MKRKSQPAARAAETASAVGAFEAKNTFGLLLERVVKGESIVITRHGTPVARLVPFTEEIDKVKIRKAIEGLRASRKGSSLGGLSIRALIEEGRR